MDFNIFCLQLADVQRILMTLNCIQL